MPGLETDVKIFYDASAPVLSLSVRQSESFVGSEIGRNRSADSERLSVVRIGLLLDRIGKKTDQMVFFIILVRISIFIVVVCISFVVAKITVAPLIAMAYRTTRIAEGGLKPNRYYQI